jgi:hypothetical protein
MRTATSPAPRPAAPAIFNPGSGKWEVIRGHLDANWSTETDRRNSTLDY